MIVVIALLAFYNLEYAPRTWHDEGAALSLARTLAEDGVYAVKTSDGYQTFGPVQSVGPTVILPVALSFKLNGVGLVQGRMIAAVYLLFTLAVFYALTRRLFGWQTALVAVALLLGSQLARMLYQGRQVLGEVPALGFWLCGWLVWLRGEGSGRRWPAVVAGLLFGAAIVTKSSYLFIAAGTLGVLAILDLGFYRQGAIKNIVIAGLVALACVAAWYGWQVLYFGMETFQENAGKLSELTSGTAGFSLRAAFAAIESILGPDWGHFYYLWGVPALLYGGILCLPRNRHSIAAASLVVFGVLWLAYYLVWDVTWLSYTFAPAAITAIFVSKLWHDLVGGFSISWDDLRLELRQRKPGNAAMKAIVLAMLVLLIGYPLQSQLRHDVLAQDRSPQEVAQFLDETVDQGIVVETWERELSILTDHRYHFPDQSLLARTHAAMYRGGSRDYALGADYFRKYQPSYLVVGWFARWTGIYDADFIARYGKLISTIGDYEIYELHLTPLLQQGKTLDGRHQTWLGHQCAPEGGC